NPLGSKYVDEYGDKYGNQYNNKYGNEYGNKHRNKYGDEYNNDYSDKYEDTKSNRKAKKVPTNTSVKEPMKAPEKAPAKTFRNANNDHCDNTKNRSFSQLEMIIQILELYSLVPIILESQYSTIADAVYLWIYNPVFLISWLLHPKYFLAKVIRPELLTFVKKEANDYLVKDPVYFWNNFINEIPELAIFAARLMSIPPTSADSERFWSLMAGIHTLKHNRLTNDQATKLSLDQTNTNTTNDSDTAYNLETDFITEDEFYTLQNLEQQLENSEETLLTTIKNFDGFNTYDQVSYNQIIEEDNTWSFNQIEYSTALEDLFLLEKLDNVSLNF
ncbi:4283_t:CDS:2, partial [Cetraspora pellucida]